MAAITPFLLWFGKVFLDDFSYCEALENAAAPIKHFVTVRNGASVVKHRCMRIGPCFYTAERKKSQFRNLKVGVKVIS